MRTRGFVRNLEYDAVPRTTVLIEQFISVIAVTFDTAPATESQYVNCTECVVTGQRGFQPAMRRTCRVKADD